MQEFIRRIARQPSESIQPVREIAPSAPEELSLETLEQVAGGTTEPAPAGIDGPHSTW